MPAISFFFREDNNRSMVKPQAHTELGLSLRPISLGSLEAPRQLGNLHSLGEIEVTRIDNQTLTEFIWVYAAPLDEVMETVYNVLS